MSVSVTFKPSSLGRSDIFHLGAEFRYPRSKHPVITWMLRESLCIALFGCLLCTIVGFVSDTTIYPALRLALLVVPALLLTWSIYVAARTRWAYWAYRMTDIYVVELSEDGVSLRDRDSAWQTRWKSTFEILVTPRFIFVRCGKPTTIWIPRQAFASSEIEDEFVRVGRLFQAAATGETKAVTSSEV